MDAFQLIQSFFSRMRCNFCSHSFTPEDIQLLRQEEGIYIVNVYCTHCETQNGVAMVGVETPQHEHSFPDPELTDEELMRLAEFDPITEDDVLSAHQFIHNLDGNWQRFIPQEMLERCTAPETESQDD
ncbi:hypothetical protein [Vampirovibrio chlorellavorus]|uniref:hypothetical protein n=1 Tax=Vampirovibrio chlorellavorus TaxID=758823 RepID=UPI0026F2F6B2|nr:hypothetical protein [Vampirovibrio chlorellavorus]